MLDIPELKRYINEQFNGSIYKASKAIGLSYSGLYRIILGQRKAGIRTINAILNYYHNNCTITDKYVFFTIRVDQGQCCRDFQSFTTAL